MKTCGKRCIRCWRNKLKHCTKIKSTDYNVRNEAREVLLYGSKDDDLTKEMIQLDRILCERKPDTMTTKEYIAWRKPLVQHLNELRWQQKFMSSLEWWLLVDIYPDKYKEVYISWLEKLKSRRGKAYIPNDKDIGVFRWKLEHQLF